MRHGLLERVKYLAAIIFKLVSRKGLLPQQEMCISSDCRTESLIKYEIKNTTWHLKWMKNNVLQLGKVT